MIQRAWRAANSLLTGVLGPQIGVYNGVAARDRAVLNRDHEPRFKRHLVAAVREHVSPGDEVVVVGGGRAVVAVHAARLGADVTVYEAGDSALEVTDTVRELNDVTFDVEHAVVGRPVAVTGQPSVRRVDPADLDGDVLILDCEGAERYILPDVEGFETTIVETHPQFGASLTTVRESLPDAAVVGPDPIDGEVVVG